jgi:hypothetical protein
VKGTAVSQFAVCKTLSQSLFGKVEGRKVSYALAHVGDSSIELSSLDVLRTRGSCPRNRPPTALQSRGKADFRPSEANPTPYQTRSQFITKKPEEPRVYGEV